MKLKLEFPLKKTFVTQYFGEVSSLPIYQANNINIIGHNGIDFHAVDGQDVFASHEGIVTYAGKDDKEGIGIVIRTLEKFDYENGQTFYKTIYWHLKDYVVKINDRVAAGQLIGHADNTGLSTGTHLHYGLKPIAQGENEWSWWNVEQKNGYLGAINPMKFLLSYEFKNNLFLNQKNHDIAVLQRILQLSNQFPQVEDLITGYYGEITRAGVRNFQIIHKCAPWYEIMFLNGKKVGPKTRKKLNELYG